MPTTPAPLPPVPADLSTSSADFWSASPRSAVWSVATNNGEQHLYATQARTVIRAIKTALGRSTLDLRWTVADSNALYDRLTAANLRTVSMTRGQTVWTPEMLSDALWLAFSRTVSTPAGVVVPARIVLPRSNEDPPQDGSAWTNTTPEVFLVPDAAVTPSTPPLVEPTLDQLDWSRGDFWSGNRHSARWIVTLPDGKRRRCASQARSVLRGVKSRINLLGQVPPEDLGTWSAAQTSRLARWYTDQGQTVPFSGSEVVWTPELLRYALAVYSGARPDQIVLPATLSLPGQGVPPTDGRDTSVEGPDCSDPEPIPAAPSTVTPAIPPSTDLIPVPGAAPVLWVMPNCPECDRAREYLDARDVRYRVRDATDSAYRPAWFVTQVRVQQLGLRRGVVPLLEGATGSSLVVGFSEERYNQVFGLTPRPSRRWIWYTAAAAATVGAGWYLWRRSHRTG